MTISIRSALEPAKRALQFIGALLLGAILGFYGHGWLFPDTTPVQPIEFSHKVHAGDNQIPCQYCHIYARRSTSAGVPSVNKCINCHKSMETTSAELDKLFAYWREREPIPWIKVHDLPDFVYFPHKRHVAAEVDCAECHGDVAGMARVSRVAPLQMGWCRDCHKKNHVNNGQQCSTCHK
ncbi:MAG: cytochrome c3 family protein [Xanthomonadales bacterium]|nr:cytochrome c3 family protein [Xanthomonadales bacterium]